MSTAIEPPSQLGTRDGLAYALFLPGVAARGGVVMVHGAGSQKENHADYARAAVANGFAALTFDNRGHGDTEGALALVESLQLETYPYLHSTRAELLRRLDRVEDARAAYGRALELVPSEAERRFLVNRLNEL